MDLSAMKDLYIGSTPVQSAWLGGTKVWERTPAVDIQAIKDAMLLWYDLKRQGATNESMAATPELVNLAYDPDKAHVIDWTQFSTRGDGVQQFSIEITSTTNYWVINQGAYHRTNSIPSFYVEVANLPEGKVINYFYGNGSDERQTYAITYNGLHKLPACKISPNVTTASGFFISNENGQTVADVVGTTITQVNPSMNATCYNFAWNFDSGVRSKQITFADFNSDNVTVLDLYTSDKGTNGQPAVDKNFNSVRVSYSNRKNNIDSFKVRVTNLDTSFIASIGYFYRDNAGNESYIKFDKDGDYILPMSYNLIDGTGDSNGFGIYFKDGSAIIKNKFAATIEILPIEYSNALVADGVDDYALVEGLPLLTKDRGFTVVYKRTILGDPNDAYKVFAAKRQGTQDAEHWGAFTLEKGPNVYPFGQINEITINTDDIGYMTPTSYCGQPIQSGNQVDHDHLALFCGADDGNEKQSVALYSFILFDRTLTKDEVDWVKTNLIEGDTEL